MTICRSWYGAMSGPGSIVNIFFCPPYARDTKPGLALLGEEPLVLPLLLFVGRVRELIESVRDDQATAGVELASVGSKIVNRPAVLSRPAPPPLHEIAYVRLAVDHPHDRRRVGDLDVLTRLDVGRAFGEADLDLEVREVLEDLRRFHLQAIVVAHAGLRLEASVAGNSCSYYVPICDRNPVRSQHASGSAPRDHTAERGGR